MLLQTKHAKMQAMEWSDLQYLLSVARRGSLAAAGREIGVDQTTVGRRVQALEKSLGSKLFDRVDRRWVPTASGTLALQLAERVEAEVLGSSALIAGQDKALTGTVRLTSVAFVISCLLAPEADSFVRQHPGLKLEMLATPDNLDLRKLQAEIALRLARPRDPNAVTRRIATVHYQVYAAKRFIRRTRELPWVAIDSSLGRTPEARWVQSQLGKSKDGNDNKPALRVSDSYAMATIAMATPCRVLLPIAMARTFPDLVPVAGPEPVLTRDLWLVYMKAMRGNARIAAVNKWITAACDSVQL